MKPFTCPLCGKECPTLREFLSCHPREVRAMTALLEGTRFGHIRLSTLFAGDYTPALYLAAMDSLDPQVTEVAA